MNAGPPETPPLLPARPPQRSRWPWAQIGLLSLNTGLYLMALNDFVMLTGTNVIQSRGIVSMLCFFGGLVLYFRSPKPQRGQPQTDEDVPYSGGLHFLNVAIFGATISMTTLALLIPSLWRADQAVQRQNTAEQGQTPEEWETVRSPRTGVVVDVPSHWVESPDPTHRGHEISRADLSNDLWFLLSAVPKEDVTYPNFEAWAEAILESHRANFEASEVIERATSKARDLSTMDLVLELEIQNTRMVCLMRFLETPESYLWARVTAIRSKFRTHEAMLRQMIRSVRREEEKALGI